MPQPISENALRKKYFPAIAGKWTAAEKEYKTSIKQRTYREFCTAWQERGYGDMQPIEDICKTVVIACDWIPGHFLLPQDEMKAVTINGSSEMYEICLPLQIKNDLNVDISDDEFATIATMEALVRRLIPSS